MDERLFLYRKELNSVRGDLASINNKNKYSESLVHKILKRIDK